MVDQIEKDAVCVAGKEISADRIAAEMQNHPADDAEAAWEAAARALVVRELLLGEARRLGLEPEETSDHRGRKMTEEDALVETLIEREVSVPVATETEARRFYETHLDRFASEPLVEAEHILFSASPDDAIAWNMALSDARGLIRQLRDDPDRFAELARTHSACPSREQGGNLGQIGPGQTVPEFEQALFALGEGELCAEPVPTHYGVHIVRAGRKVEARQLPFEAVDASIRAYLEESSLRRAMAQYLAILASQADIRGVALPASEGPLVQ